ncbi:MAG: CBS domain-containing protein [Gemmatimonadota bacterium]|nr:CBS domain-containing protein [Gemmatimonadota bacterium]
MRIQGILRDKGSDVHTIGSDRTVLDAVRELNRRRIGALVVTDAAGAIAGIVSERDILGATARAWETADGGTAVRDLPVSEIMTAEVIIATPDDGVDYAMGIMTQNRIRHLPILAGGRLAGIISIGDVVRAHLHEAAYENKMMRDYIRGGVSAI